MTKFWHLSAWLHLFLAFSIVIKTHSALSEGRYYGKLLGDMRTNAHGVRGKVYALNENMLLIKNFHYDGQGPDAYFWGDYGKQPSTSGFIIPDEKGTFQVLRRYDGGNIIITLPDGKTLKDIKSFSVWCRRYSVDFGSIIISGDDFPRERSLGPLTTYAHGVRSNDVIFKDEKTIFISKLYYDGAGPDAFFLVGNGSRPHSRGVKVPDENNSLEKLKGYEGKDITLRLPGDLTVFDIEWFGLYCIAFEQNFGNVYIPIRANVPVNIADLRSALAAPTLSRSASSSKLRRNTGNSYFGKRIGDFITNAHDVKGTVYAASEDTFYITNFNYDGQGPDAFFWAGTTDKPSPEGFIVPDDFSTKQVLKKYKDQNIVITLPEGQKITDIKWLSVWCRKFAVNFGSIMIPSDLVLPKEVDLGPLPSFAHSTKADKVTIKDARTIHISGLHYDGSAPDAFFYVGTGHQPHEIGIKVPDENGSLKKLKGYQGQDVVIRLPADLTIFDVDWFALFCISFKQNFGHVMIPKDLNVPADIKTLKAAEMKFENCEEIFPGIMHVSWKVVGQDLYIQLMGKADENQYLSFGRSGQDDYAAMVGADVVVAYHDADENQVKVVDYYLSAKSQCSQGTGVCPDTNLRGNQNAMLVSYERRDGHLSVTYKRPLAAGDGQDLSIPLSIPVTIVAAIGSMNSQKEASYHLHYYTKDTIKIHFGRTPKNMCKSIDHGSVTTKVKVWPPHRITDETTFHAQIGPTGGDKGYTAITGSQSWGIAWWINGLLIPELYVQRGVNYTFIVEGGDDPTNLAMYHPLYITNDEKGGGGQFLNQLGTEKHKIYAGITTDGQALIPIGVGRQCEWKHKTVDQADKVESFEEYKSTLELKCLEGNPGRFVWMPDEDTPDLVYYQCMTHRHLGWKIHVKGNVRDGLAMGHRSGLASCFIPSSILIFMFVMFLFYLN